MATQVGSGGQTYDPNNGVQQPRKTTRFMEFPFDIRSMVYEHFFETQFVEHDDPNLSGTTPDGTNFLGATLLTWPTGEDPNDAVDRSKSIAIFTAHAKVSLLVAAKCIAIEAAPFFHRLHVFRMKLLDLDRAPFQPFYYSAGCQQVFGAITAFDLVSDFSELTCSSTFNTAEYLRLLRQYCPMLKRLSVDVSYITFVEAIVLTLQRMWPRLDFLQVCIETLGEQDFMPYSDEIAPGQIWYRAEKHPSLDEHALSMLEPKKTIFSVRRNLRVHSPAVLPADTQGYETAARLSQPD